MMDVPTAGVARRFFRILGVFGLWAGLGLPAGCTHDQEVVSSVVVLDPLDGSELDKRSHVGESGYVRVGAMPAGRDDLLVWQLDGELALREDGQWRDMPVGAHNVAFGPVNGDGPLEIFGGAGNRALIWSAEDGSLLAQTESATFPWDVVAGDWDGDGDTDLILSSPTTGAAFHARDADGLGELQTLSESFGLDYHMNVGDLDDDGRLDVVRHLDKTIAVVFGGPDGAVDEVFQIGVEPRDIERIALADITGDGALDVVVGAEDGTQVFENAGNRSLTAMASFPGLVSRTVVVDFDGDGDLDILGQPPRDDREDWGKEVLVVRNDGETLADPEPLFEHSEQIVDIVAGKDSDGNAWLGLSTFRLRDLPWEPERRY